MSWILGRHGIPEIAARLFGTTEATLRNLVMIRCLTDLREVEREIDFVRGFLGEQAYAAAFAEGQAIPLEQALDTALKKIEDRRLSEKATS